jgi:hypothetical protein
MIGLVPADAQMLVALKNSPSSCKLVVKADYQVMAENHASMALSLKV